MNPYEIKGPYNPNPPKPKPKKRPLELGMEQLADVGHIIAIASGKGGVGKSTVAVNLAVTLVRMGYKVGLADADVYGPSIPTMTGTQGGIPEVVTQNGILVPPGDVDALREAILSVTRPGTAEQMGAVSLEKVKPFYPSSVMAALEKMYRSLL